MVDNWLQCCYTNDNGWRSAAVSDALPKSAYAFCTRFQAVNSDIPPDGWRAEDGTALSLLEVHGNDAYVCLCRTQYGLTDRVGRQNMFSHAFLLPWRAALRDPNVFLTIADENFAVDLETAEARHAGVYLPPFALDAALSDLGMNQASYLALIRAVCVQLAEPRTPDPLYIESDGSDLQMRKLLYCVYVGLPYHLRKQLNAASAATRAPERMQLIFSADAASRKRHFIPRSGQENVLTQKHLARFERGGYLDHAPRCLQTELENPGAFLRFFDELESRAATLGGGKSELRFRVAYRLMQNADYESMTGSELELRLTEALRARPRASGALNQYIADLLRVMAKRGLTPQEPGDIPVDGPKENNSK
ncbi:MAG: hypothetical protein K6G54_08880 [Oscillospiraceae bacterium]|nr:hypothetical protein [Oscillospiraceae bacterium]